MHRRGLGLPVKKCVFTILYQLELVHSSKIINVEPTPEVPHKIAFSEYQTWARERPPKYCSEFIPTPAFIGRFSAETLLLWAVNRVYKKLSRRTPFFFCHRELRAKERSGGMTKMSETHDKGKKSRGPHSQLVIIPYSLSIRIFTCLLYTSPSPRDQRGSRMPSSA